MKKLYLILSVLALCAIANGTVSITQDSGPKSCSAGTTCTQTNILSTNITGGHALVFMTRQAQSSGTNTVTAVSGTNGTGTDTFLHSSGCLSGITGAGFSSDIWYEISSVGGYKSITITNSSGATVTTVELVEVAATGSNTFTLDSCVHADITTATTTPTAASFTGMTGSNDALLQLAGGSASTTMTAITNSYTLASSNTTALNYAFLLNSTTATGPQWTGSSVKYGLSSIALSEHSSGAVIRHKVTQR